MTVLKCKMCGGDLMVEAGMTVAECEYCGTKQTVPNMDSEKKAQLFERAGRLLRTCQFDAASGAFAAIAMEYPQEAEAHWGQLLCRYGIEYVDDPATGKKIPTCHRSSFTSFLEEKDFELVMETADPIARKVYREEAKQIEEIRKGIIEVSIKEEPYDIFICYKETDEKGDRTIDSVIAQDVYKELTSNGYRVFFSRISLEDKLGQAYEPYIFAALNSAKVMLAFGTDYEYYNAVWVKNEWSRFLQLIERGEKKVLIPCYKNIDAYDMPKEFSHLQAQDMGKVGAIQDLLRGIEKIIPKEKDTKNRTTAGITSDKSSLVEQAFSLLENGNFSAAMVLCDEALEINPHDSKAYVGKLMAELQIKTFSVKGFGGKSYKDNPNYKKAINCADEYIKGMFASIDAAAQKRAKQKAQLIKILPIAIALFIVVFLGVRELRYSSAKKAFINAEDYAKVSEVFLSLGNYRDSKAYAAGALLAKGNRSDAKALGAKKIILSEAAMRYLNSNVLSGWDNLKTAEICDNTTFISADAFYGCKQLSSVVIPDSVELIGSCAFAQCINLEAITIPDGVRRIDDSAFIGCSKLTEVNIPNSVVQIGDNAFSRCSSLEKLTFSDSVKILGSYVFANCDSLEEVSLPDDINQIGENVFFDCDNLKNIHCEGSKEGELWNNLWNDNCNATVHWAVQ